MGLLRRVIRYTHCRLNVSSNDEMIAPYETVRRNMLKVVYQSWMLLGAVEGCFVFFLRCVFNDFFREVFVIFLSSIPFVEFSLTEC